MPRNFRFAQPHYPGGIPLQLRYGPRRRMIMAGGLFGSIAKIAGKIAMPALKAIPGIGTAVSLASLGSSALGAAKGLMKPKLTVPTLTGSNLPVPYIPGGPLASATGGRLAKLALGAGAGAAAVAGYQALTGGGQRRRYRRMNYANMRALRRSCKRVKGFEKMAKECISLGQRVRVRKGRKCR